MTPDDPGRTVPRTPAAPESTTDHLPPDDTEVRAGDESSADPDRTAPRPASETPVAEGTVARTPSGTAQEEAHAQARAAEGVPGYVLLRELGRGGMGVVYEARHLKLNRVVALKMMLGGEQASKSELIRFLAEAESVAAVRHENVVQVYDYGEAGGRPFMALEFCPGGMLGKLLPRGAGAAKNPREMAALLAKVARGVAAAHALGIVHRDLKPGNVLLDEHGTPKVADFGLAKRGEGSDVTQAGVGMGTPAYMAPEQARDAKFVGPQADVWALGVMLYEALTGTRPFRGTVQEIIAKAANADPLPPRKSAPSVPRDLELICLKCLSKQPHERYPMAKELADDLDRYARNEPISVRPAGAIERAAKWVKRNKVASGAAAAVFLALAVGTGASLGFGMEARKQADEAQKQKREADEAADREKFAAQRATDAAAVANREKQDAIAARNELRLKSDELKRTLAEALLGPILAKSHEKPLTPHEAETFWRIAKLRRSEVAFMFLEEATRTPLAREQLESRAEFAVHASLGLDLARRRAADQLFLARLGEPGAQVGQALSLAVSISKADFTSPETTLASARTLTEALGKETNSSARHELAKGVARVAARLEPAEAARVRAQAARTLAGALGTAADSYSRQELIKGLAAVTAQMDHAEAAKLRARAAGVSAGAFNRAINPFARRDLARGMAAVAPWMEPAEAAKVCTQAAYVLADALKKESNHLARYQLARELGAAAAWMEPTEAARLCAPAARTLTAALNTTTDYSVRSQLAAGVAALAPRMEPAEAARTLTDLLDKALDSSGRGALAASLVAVASRMGPAEATRVYAQVARALADAFNKTPDFLGRSRLAARLAAVASRLEPAEAARLCAPVARTLAEALEKETSSTGRALLAESLATVAGHIDPSEAAKACTQAARSLAGALDKEPSPYARRELAKGMTALAARLEPAEAARACAQAVRTLTDTLDKTMSFHDLAEVLTVTTLGLPPGGRHRSQGATLLATGTFATPHNLIPSLALLHPHFQPHPRPLPAQELVELLKHPFCVDEARRAVLDALEFTYNRPFKDQWDFVEYAQRHQPHLDLLTPPKRPEPKP